MNTNTASTKTLRRRVLTTVAVALLGATIAAPAANAADAGTAESRLAVRYGDLNLASTAGAETLYTRLRAAAAVVCDGTSQGDLIARVHARHCRADAIADAVAAVNHPAFSSWYAAKVGRPSAAGALVASK